MIWEYFSSSLWVRVDDYSYENNNTREFAEMDKKGCSTEIRWMSRKFFRFKIFCFTKIICFVCVGIIREPSKNSTAKAELWCDKKSIHRMARNKSLRKYFCVLTQHKNVHRWSINTTSTSRNSKQNIFASWLSSIPCSSPTVLVPTNYSKIFLGIIVYTHIGLLLAVGKF